MPMVRCPECRVPQYAASPYATVPECVECGRTLLLLPRFARTAELARPGRIRGERLPERPLAELRA